MSCCETCKYWKPYQNSRWEGMCRINQPKKNNLRLGPGEWPNTRCDDFCGKYQNKDTELKSESAEPQTQTCKTCKYYTFTRDHAMCCRFPPQVFVWRDMRRDAFPMVGIDNYCGEWKAKEAK